ncbi:MAG: glycosyltransferase [Candidatus Shapirobacteria bacterium]
MTNNSPLVSVILPVYNAGKYLSLAIDSILNQQFNDYEFIIINDGSTDDSEEIVLKYKDKQIRYYRNQKNMGLVFTLNRAIKMSRGKYLARMDSDDVSRADRLDKQVKFMESNLGVMVCGSFARMIDEKGHVLGKLTPPTGWLLKYNYWKPSPMIHPTVMMRREVFDNLEYDLEAKCAEDYDLWLKCSGRLYNIDEYLLNYRINLNGISQTGRNLQLQSSYRSFKTIVGLKEISFEEYLSLCSLQFDMSVMLRWKLIGKLSNHIDYPKWFAVLDSMVYFFRKISK